MRKMFLTAATALTIRPLRLLAVLLVTAAFAAPLSAQSSSSVSGYTPSGAAPGSPSGSYPLSGFDTVNPYNGGLNFSLPLVQIGGRGSAGYTMHLRIEQRWTLRHDVVEDVETNQRWDFLVPEYNWWTGLEPGYGPGVLQGRQVGNGLMVCTTHSPHYSTFHQTLTRLTFTAPDGTEFELRDRATNGQPALLPNCARYLTPPSRGKVFVSTDGSSATFVSDEVIYDNIEYSSNIYPSGYLMLKDGTRYRIDGGGVSWMRDRNGNRVTFGGGGTSVTDSLNRQVTIDYNVTDAAPYGLCDRITRKGFGDVSRTVRVSKAPLGSALRAGYSLQSYTSLFPDALSTSSTQHNPTVTSAVWLPNGRSYKFFYNSHGELARVELPTGGAVEYDWAAGATGGPASGVNEVGSNAHWIYRRVVERRSYANGTTLEGKMTYSRPEHRTSANTHSNLGYVDVSQLDAVGALLAKTRHYYHGSPTQSLFASSQNAAYHTPWKEGREWQTEAFAADGATVLRRAAHTWQQPVAGGTWPLTQAEANDGVQTNDPQVTLSLTTLEPSGANLVSAQVFAYDQYSNRTDVWEHDFGAGSAGPLVRRTQTAYVTTNNGVNYAALNPNATSPDVNSTHHLRSLPQRQSVYDAAGVERARVVYEYDNYNADANHAGLVGRAGIVGLCDTTALVNNWAQCVLSNPTGYTARGNVTAVTSYADAAGLTGAATTYAQYDVAGNVVASIDARSNTSTVSYTDAFSDGVGRNTYAFPTGTTSAVPAPPSPHPAAGRGSDTPLTTAAVYDYWTGLVRSSTDANNKVTSFGYDDPLDRLKRVDRPDGGRTTYTYVDQHQCGPYVQTRTLLDSAGRETDDYLFFDGLGRGVRSFKYDPQDASNPYQTADTQYDALGRVRRVSNPYRSSGCTSAVNPLERWMTTDYDALGRVKTVTTPDGAAVRTDYDGARVLVTDQADKQRVSRTDALGRLLDVWEVRPTASGTEPLSFPSRFGVPAVSAGYRTAYAYDALGNLRRVTQGDQLRHFMYDSLGRLIRAKNPEQTGTISADADFPALTDTSLGTPVNGQWSVGYVYDANGNLAKRRDARNVTTTYHYDNLNRLIRTDYSDGTPFTLLTYDFATNGRGNFYANYESSTQGTINYVFAYDAMGRPTSSQTAFYLSGTGWLPGYDYSRGYDKAGNVAAQNYPSGRIVSYNYDEAGRLSDHNGQAAFSGNLGDGVVRAYSAGVSYDEAGRVRQERFGTATPLYHKLHRNVRGQLYDVRLSTVEWQPNGAGEWDWNRGALLLYYGGAAHGQSSVSNNGNLTMAQHWVPANDQLAVYNYTQQTYAYDDLNRLSSVAEQAGTQGGLGGAHAAQAYTYDRWGNRTINTGATSGANINAREFVVNTATNRLGVPSTQTGAMAYDDAGNLTNDTYTSAGSRTYDAENRMTSAWGYSPLLNGNFQSRYVYDAAGKRTRRQTDAGEVWQVYGFDGELLAEYGAAASPAAPRKEYGYRGGEMLVASEGVSSGPAADTVWVEDSLPAGAWHCVCGVNEAWNWAGSNPAPASGSSANQMQASAGLHQQFFEGATQTLSVSAGDNLVAHVYLDPANPPSEIMLQWNAPIGGWEHRAYWGANEIAWGADGTNSRRYMGALPPAGRWVRLEVPAEAVGLVGQAAHGLALTLYGGRATWDRVGKAAVAGPRWLVTDHLGTPRMTGDKTGSLSGIRRHDHLPFGEELGENVGGRNTNQGYVSDDIRQKFTGYERDGEIGLDYAQARYHSPMMGRFISPDELFADQWEEEPQSWNLYTYVRNSPLIYTDPSGLWREVNCSSGPGTCWESDRKDDTYASLAKLIGVNASQLAQFFSNQRITLGQVFDTSNFARWRFDGVFGSQRRAWRPNSNIIYKLAYEQAMREAANFEPPLEARDGVEFAAGITGRGGKPKGSILRKASAGLRALFDNGRSSIRNMPIINIRTILRQNGFTQRLAEKGKGYLFENPATGEQVRVMRRGGGWDVRVKSSGGTYLDEWGNGALNPAASHNIWVKSR